MAGGRALHWACWRGQYEAARALVEGGADIHAINRYGADALRTTRHGSVRCQDPFGGVAMKLPEEIAHGGYAAIVDLLVAAGARRPGRAGGSEPVQDALRRHGVPDGD